MSKELIKRGLANNEKRITNHGVRKIEQMAADGLSEATMAKALRIARATFLKRKKDDPRVAEALTTGRGKLDDEVANMLLEKARGGNLTAMIYFDKARLGHRDQGPATAEDHKTPQVNIQINAPMSDEDFRKMIKVDGTD
jgi:hypothetical protein